MIITKRTILLTFAIILILGVSFFAPRLLKGIERYVHGVKPGVHLEGQLVAGLLKEELYDVVASLAESKYVEASNASCDWQTGLIQAEIVGQLVDVESTVTNLLQAPSQAQVELVIVQVLPSITSAHFQPYYRGSTDEKKIALLINVDWGDEFIPDMLDVLAHYDADVTWFPTGRWAKRAPELVKAMDLAGHELGNHGGWHGMPSQMDRVEVAKLIQDGEDAIFEASGQKSRLFAPPAGDFNQQTVAVAAELGYKTILWTIDTVDWQRPAPTVIVDRVMSKVKNGAFVLMHPTKPTLEALPLILDQLQTLGFTCVTASELLVD